MLSIIVKEHNESEDKIGKMIDQASYIPFKKELIIATSKKTDDFLDLYNIDQYNFPIKAVTGTSDAGNGAFLGALESKGDNLLIMDCHICYQPQETAILIDTLEKNPDSIVTPGISIVDFPSCNVKVIGAVGYGVKFRISNKKPFEWVWLPKKFDTPYMVPIACGGAIAMKKGTFNDLFKYGGMKTAFDFEEEKSARLAKLGHHTLIDPRVIFGHWFKTSIAPQMAKNWYKSRAAALYINTLDDNRWEKINEILTRSWGPLWINVLEDVYRDYTVIRNNLMKYKDSINENWYFEISNSK